MTEKRASLVVFEGINGCGKTTIANAMKTIGAKCGIEVGLLTEYRSKITNDIRILNISDRKYTGDFILESLLVACERRCALADLNKLTQPIQVMERGKLSLFAFAEVRKISAHWVTSLIDVALPEFPECLTVLVDIDASDAITRLRSLEKHRYELLPEEFYRELRQAYIDNLARINSSQVLVLKGTDDPVYNANAVLHRAESL